MTTDDMIREMVSRGRLTITENLNEKTARHLAEQRISMGNPTRGVVVYSSLHATSRDDAVLFLYKSFSDHVELL